MDEPTDPTASLTDVVQSLDGALRNFFSSRVPVADAEDLLQECYLRVTRGLSDVRDEDRLAGWVFRIARNLVADFYRAKKDVAHLDANELVEPSVDSQADRTLRVGEWLAPMIDALPEKYAVALRESELAGKPHREIAEQLGLSVSGVKSRVQRGRVLLRDKLNACCSLKFDARGGILDVERRSTDGSDVCGPGDCC